MAKGREVHASTTAVPQNSKAVQTTFRENPPKKFLLAVAKCALKSTQHASREQKTKK